MKLQFWEKQEPKIEDYLKVSEYINTAKFYDEYNSRSVDEQKLIRKKIAIFVDCIDEYKSALEYELENRFGVKQS